MTNDRTDKEATTLFREQQRLPWPFRFLRLDVVVDEQYAHVRLSSLLAPFSRQVPLADVVDVEVHDQLSRHVPGAWGRFRVLGVRTAPGLGAMYNLTAKRGVSLRLRNGRRIVIGSNDPEQLAAAVRQSGGETGPGPA